MSCVKLHILYEQYKMTEMRVCYKKEQIPDYTYDEHGNMLTMPHIKNYWDEKDRLFSAGNSTFINYNNYDAQGNRTRKVVEKGNIIETRYYINGYELFRKEVNGVIEVERTTINIADDEKVFVRIETETGQKEVIRYQYDNHLGSACLELDNSGQIISYEEYHPFGTTSYRSGQNDVEVSLKRYKYCGKERDDETGLYYYGMRYYAAWICRFVSVDPLQFEYPEYTPYQYAGNKPITFIDLDGGEEKKPDELQIQPIVNVPPRGIFEKISNFNKMIHEANETLKELSYKKEIRNGIMQSDDITKQIIPEIERGELNEIVGIVLHRTAGSTTQSALSAFKERKLGTHFLVGKDGKIIQTAHLDKKTFHVGVPKSNDYPNNSNSIGIEVVGTYDYKTKTWEELTPDQTTSVANLVNYLMVTFNLNPNTDLYIHEKIAAKTPGEGQVVLDAIKDLLIIPKYQFNSKKENNQ